MKTWPIISFFVKFYKERKIKTFNIDKMWGLETPEDLNYFLKNHK
jgi:hypothetical protein